MIIFFDLEGPLCPIDHAADVLATIGKSLGKQEDFYQLFKMISLYDDELFLVDRKKDYWPGDTLKLIAPIIVSYGDEELLLEISQNAELTPGAKKLFDYLHEEKVPAYIISTSYTQHAHTIARKLAHPIENVRCTTLDFHLKPKDTSLLNELFEEIFPKYLREGLPAVKSELDRFFFEKMPQSPFGALFQRTIVCGGGRKRKYVKDILASLGKRADEAIAIGDSITDIQMLEFVRDNSGLAVSFNGNEYSLKPAMVAYSGRSIEGLISLFRAFPDYEQFIKGLSKEEMVQREVFYDLLHELNSEDFQNVLNRQKKYRKILRQKAASLT